MRVNAICFNRNRTAAAFTLRTTFHFSVVSSLPSSEYIVEILAYIILTLDMHFKVISAVIHFPTFVHFLCMCSLVLSTSSERVKSSMKRNTIKQLRMDLLDGYDNLARPVQNFTKTTVVKMSFFPMHLTELNEEQGIMILEGFLDVSWRDEHLQWDVTKYESIKTVHFNQEEIWKPDITVFEGKGSEVDPLNDRVHIFVNSTGHVVWTPPATIQSVCQLHYHYYPYDKQSCMVTFGSWVQDGAFVDLQFISEDPEMNIDDSSPTNPLWKIITVSSKRKEEVMPSSTGPGVDKYVALEYTVHLERRIALSQIVSFVPKVVAIFLHLAMFWLPANSEKKLILGSCGLLLQTLTMLYIGVSIPTPAAGTFALSSIRSELATGIAAVVFQILIMNIALVKSFSPPNVIKRLNAGVISQILCLCTVPSTSQAGDSSELVDGPSKSNENEWYLMATLLDRILFIVFSLAFTIEGSV